MNAERLKSIVESLQAAETKYAVQAKLTGLQGAVANLAGSPTDQTHQQAVVSSLDELESAVASFVQACSPAELKNLAQVGGYEFFSTEMVAQVASAVSKSGMTPAVLQKQVADLVTKRQAYLETLKRIRAGLDSIGIHAQTLAPGEAEIGILIPRDLFNNDLDGFQKELKTLNTIIRTFYEVSNVTPEQISLRQISTTDPIIFLGMDITVLISLGHAIRWCVDTIKGTLDIKKIVDAARAASLDKNVVGALEAQIESRIASSVDQKVKEILAGYQGGQARANELRSPLKTSLEQILQRIDRGMTVEIRFLPPAASADKDAGPQEARSQKFEELAEISKSLEFPQIPPGHPMMQLTQTEA